VEAADIGGLSGAARSLDPGSQQRSPAYLDRYAERQSNVVYYEKPAREHWLAGSLTIASEAPGGVIRSLA
jgi:hypothetical protein